MNRIIDLVVFETGSPQFRINETTDIGATQYYYYRQNELEADLNRIELNRASQKSIKTYDKVSTVKKGDVVFSLISGVASIVSEKYSGYLITQNYVKLIPTDNLLPTYLIYLLNEDESIKRQFYRELQGSATIKYTLKQVKGLQLPDLPIIELQELIGNLYLNQLHLEAVEKRLISLKSQRLLLQLKEARRQ